MWGVDQEFGALHLIDRLYALLPRTRSNTLLDSLRGAVRAAETRRDGHGGEHWLARSSNPETIRSVRRSIAPRAGSEEAEILDALEMSAHLYELNRRASKELTGFAANNEREEYMKRQFAMQYREAAKRDAAQPHVLAKMGSAHLSRGQSPFGPFAFGNLLAELATANGAGFMNMIVLAHNAPADSTAPNLWKWADMRPVAEATSPEQTTVVDLRPLRPFIYAGKVGVVGADLRRTIYGYDFMVLLGKASNASER